MKYLYILFVMAAAFVNLYPSDNTNADTMTNTAVKTAEHGNEAKYTLPEIVVTASRMEQLQKDVAASVTVIGKKEIEEKGGSDVKDLLQSVPGMDVSQAGGLGGTANIFLRGTMPGSTLVMIDGVPLNNPDDPVNAFNFAFLNTDNIERIEIIRGLQSALYGSGAIGGVINIITKKGKGEPSSILELSAGSFNTYKVAAGTQGSVSNWNYSVMLSHEASDGISKAALSNTNAEPERDGYEASTLSARAGGELFDNASVDFILRYNFAKADIDGGAYIDQLNNWMDNEDLSAGFTFKHKPLDYWNYQLSVSYFNNKNNGWAEYSFNTIDNYWLRGYNLKGGFLNTLTAFNINTLTSGADIQLDYIYTTETNQEFYRTNSSVYAEDRLNLFDIFIPSAGGRLDYSPEYGMVPTYKFSGIFLLTNIGLALKANMGTGFKAPSLYQLHSFYAGNTNLKSEYSSGFDAGFTENLWNGMLVFDAAYFQNDSSNRIDYDSSLGIYGQYINIAKSRSWGIESALIFRPAENLSLKINYTYTYAVDLETGYQLLKIPQHKGGAEAGLTLLKGLDLTVDVNYTGRRFGYSRVEMPEYIKTDLFVNYRNKNVTVYGSIDNLFNVNYQDTFGYMTPGINFKAGVRYEL